MGENQLEKKPLEEIMLMDWENRGREVKDPLLLEAIKKTREEIAKAFGDKRAVAASLAS